jgi:hypothetical protein
MALIVSAAPPAAAITYVGTTVLSDTGAAQSVAAVPIGAAAYNRTVFMVVHWNNPTSAKTLASATIGGVAATIHLQNSGNYGTSFFGAALISVPLAAGTTATVTLNFTSGAAFYHAYLATFNVTGLISTTAADTVSVSAATLSSYSGVIDVQNQGIIILGAFLYSANTGYNTSGVTEAYDAAVFTNGRIVGGSWPAVATETNRAIGITRVGSNTFNGAIVGASFR